MPGASDDRSHGAVEEFLCRLKDEYPEPVDRRDDEPAGGRHLRPRTDPDYEEWRRLSARPAPSE